MEEFSSYISTCIEVFKIMVDMQSFEFRCQCAIDVLESLKSSSENFKIKIDCLKKFYNKADNETLKAEFVLKLAKSFCIDLFKHIEDKETLVAKLSSYNKNFAAYVTKLQKMNLQFDVDNELTSGFSISYYLSAVMQENNVDNNEIVMSILFKVFNCSSKQDRELFLRNKKCLNKEFGNLKNSVNRLINFYKNRSNEILNQLKEKSIAFIIEGFDLSHEESLEKRNENARVIIDNFTNYRIEHIDQIMESVSGESNEILETFSNVMKRREDEILETWVDKTSKLRDKVYFFYCYHKYSQIDFDNWFQEMNEDPLKLELLRGKRDKVQNDFLQNANAFQKIGIKYLQHSQVGALSLVYDYIEDNDKWKSCNLFLKIGTGQGKSLAIAQTVKKIIQQNNEMQRAKQKVFVVTCYDHLAKRDFENSKKFFHFFNIRTMHFSIDSSTKDIDNNDVIYFNLETFFNVLRKKAHSTLVNGESIYIPDYKNSVLIMDEFDSLILDSDEIYQFVANFPVNNDIDLTNDINISDLFDSSFIEKLNLSLPEDFENWCTSLTRKSAESKTLVNSLGISITFVEPFLSYVKKNRQCQFVHFYLNPLVFYSKFSQVIGFSGSITKNSMHKFSNLFENKSVLYYEIPPFFGLNKMETNRTFVNSPGLIKENREDFLRAIKHEVKQKHKNQPILIFAENEIISNELESDYKCILKMLNEAKEDFLKESEIIQIETEQDIEKHIHKIGKIGFITLATRIIGRGADIKVDNDIEKGLHLIITYHPKKENVFIQMLGRTARQDEKGSYSVIARNEKKFDEIKEVRLNSKIKIVHELCEYFYKNVNPASITNKGIDWSLFATIVRELPDNDQKFKNENDLIDLAKSIFNL